MEFICNFYFKVFIWPNKKINVNIFFVKPLIYTSVFRNYTRFDFHGRKGDVTSKIIEVFLYVRISLKRSCRALMRWPNCMELKETF